MESKSLSKSIILIFLFLAAGNLCRGQDFVRAAGVRGGLTSGITYRQFIEPQLSYEAMMSFRENGLQLTVLRQLFEPALLNLSDEFFFVHGYGGHIGFTYTDRYRFVYRDIYYADRKFSPQVGVDAYLGLEYHFPGLPVQVGLDYKPFFSFSLYQFFSLHLGDAAFTLKYTF